jgi:hypothetical protein
VERRIAWSYAAAALYSQKYFLVLSTVKGRVNSMAMVRLEGLGKLKKLNDLSIAPQSFGYSVPTFNRQTNNKTKNISWINRGSRLAGNQSENSQKVETEEYSRFELLTAITISSFVDALRRFGGKYYSHLQCRGVT